MVPPKEEDERPGTALSKEEVAEALGVLDIPLARMSPEAAAVLYCKLQVLLKLMHIEPEEIPEIKS